jgi:hypothetical protein
VLGERIWSVPSAPREGLDEMNVIERSEVKEITGETPREVREAMLLDVLRIDRPQRGALRLVRSQRHSLHVIHLKRP